jgi:hypothetical protein
VVLAVRMTKESAKTTDPVTPMTGEAAKNDGSPAVRIAVESANKTPPPMTVESAKRAAYRARACRRINPRRAEGHPQARVPLDDLLWAS